MQCRTTCTCLLSCAVLACLVVGGCTITDREKEVAIAAREMSASTANCTLGLLFPISYPGLRDKLVWQTNPSLILAWTVKLLRWASVALLAVSHINSRNASIVGSETLSRIPNNFHVSYRLANTDYGPAGAVKALSAWESSGDLQKMSALVGIASSRGAKVVSPIANLYNLPVTSFDAPNRELADKAMYPTLSRTNPGSAPMFRAMAGIFQYFGWSAFNILSDDSPTSMTHMSELMTAANEHGISAVTTHVFLEGGTSSSEKLHAGMEIEKAVKALASVMRNSSSASRSLVTVFFSFQSKDMAQVLEYGMQQEIMGEGFVWLHVDRGIHLENLLNSRAAAGFLRMSFRPTSHRTADNALNKTDDRNVIWHEAIAEWGEYMQTNMELLQCDDCSPWQDKVLAKSSREAVEADAAALDSAYDAIWATVIGLASARQAGDPDVTTHIRTGGNKGGFQGASGVVSFDADGERASLGLTYSLENIQGATQHDHVSHLGTYEESRGFKREIGALPYWKGGRMGWDAPVDGFEHVQPPALPTIIDRVTIQKVLVEKKAWSASALITIMVPTIVGVLVSVWCCWYGHRHCTKITLDDEQESFNLSVRDLRQTLQITRQHGYVLSTENTQWSLKLQYVIIPKLQMDAAVRLTRREDFDIDSLDAFCVLICDDEYYCSSNTTKLLGRVLSFKGSVSSFRSLKVQNTEQQGCGAHQNSKPQNQLLRQWLLDLASDSLAELSIDRIPDDGKYRKQMNDRQLNRFFKKFMEVRIWRDNSCSLFTQLKVHVQVFMNQLAGQCHQHVHDMTSEPDGHLLIRFCWTPASGEFFSEAEAPMLAPASIIICPTKISMVPPQRQDDFRIRAIQTSSEDLLERDEERENSYCLLERIQNEDNDSLYGETIYIAQLHRRALILNRAFQEKVMDGLAQTMTGITVVPKIEGLQEPASTFSILAGSAVLTTVLSERGLEISQPLATVKILRRESVSQKNEAVPDRISTTEQSSNSNLVEVDFMRNGQQSQVKIICAPIKKKARMREKLNKYVLPNPRCEWPLTAYIADPIRLSVVCNGPAQILEMVRWFVESQEQTGLTVCRIKNKFLLKESEVEDGYRDVSLNVLFRKGSLNIIGEIQVHDSRLIHVKSKMHKLYTLKRAKHPSFIF